MTLKTLIVTLEDKEVWTDLFVDPNKIVGYWIIPSYTDDSIGLVIDSDEMNIILSANIMTVKVTEELTQYLNVKFK